MSGINLWLSLVDGNGDVGVPGTDYDDSGSWTFYQNGISGTGTPIFFPEDISNDGITQSDFTQDSVFVYCIDNNTTFAPEFQSGNGITDNGTTYDSNNSNNTAIFYNRLPKNTDGYIEFEFDSTNSQQYRFYLGLGNNIDNATNDLNYSILLQDAVFVRVYENGSAISGKSLVPGVQTFKIEVIEGEVKYYHNNTLFYTSSVSVSSDLYPKIFCDSNSARYEHSSFIADFRSQNGQAANYVLPSNDVSFFSSTSAITTNGNNMQKTTNTGSTWTHGGYSNNFIPANENGYVEIIVDNDSNSGSKRFGFDTSQTQSIDFNTMNWGFRIDPTRIYASIGSSLLNTSDNSAVTPGEVLRVERQIVSGGSKINLLRDNNIVYTFNTTYTGKLFFVGIIFSNQKKLNDWTSSHDSNGQKVAALNSCSGDCITIPVNLTNCDDTTGQNPCTDCQISILNFSAVCNGGLTLDVCIDYQANECTDAASPDGNGWTIGYALYDNGVSTQVGQSHTGTGFQINNTGAITQICFTIPMVQQNDQINIVFTDANTGNDSRGCLVKGTGIKKYPLHQPFHPTNGTNC